MTTDTATMAQASAPQEQKLMPRLNAKAPDFDALTTDGRRKLSDYEGKWLILFSHPSDFTPVCTTEFMAFAVNAPKFEKMNCELLGLSVDSNYAHIAWKRNIQENFGIEITFPIIADINMQVAQDYGMIQPMASSTEPVRATFVIDPMGVLRAMVYYPMTNGRSVQEFLRLLSSLQTSDEHGVATPEGWRPGENVIIAPPATSGAADRRQKMALQDPGYEYTDWYYCERPLTMVAKKEEEPISKEEKLVIKDDAAEEGLLPEDNEEPLVGDGRGTASGADIKIPA